MKIRNRTEAPTVSTTSPTERPSISRRTILRTGAWSIPAIAVAVAAPAAVASGGNAACLSFDGANQLVMPEPVESPQVTLSADALAAVSQWLEDHGHVWPQGLSVFSADVSVVVVGTSEGVPVTITSGKHLEHPVSVNADGSILDSMMVLTSALMLTNEDFFEQLSAYPNLIWESQTATISLGLQLAYSDGCNPLPLTFVDTFVNDGGGGADARRSAPFLPEFASPEQNGIPHRE